MLHPKVQNIDHKITVNILYQTKEEPTLDLVIELSIITLKFI